MARRRRIAILVGLAGLCALLWMRDEAPVEPVEEGPSPATSLRARLALRAQAGPLPAEAPEETEASEDASRKSEYLVVALRGVGERFMHFNGEGRLEPSLFWPLPEESPFPDSETASALQALLDAPDDEAERAWIALADAEGFSSDHIDVASDPWAAVLGLEVERRAAVRAYADAYADAWEGRPAQPWTRPHPPLPAQRVLGVPVVDPVLDLADDLIARHPDHPAADYARLYVLDGLAMSAAKDAWTEALDVLQSTDDALVITQAAQLLAALPGRQNLATRDLDRLADVFEDGWDLTECLHLSAFGLEQAIASGDFGRTGAWLERFERSTQEACAGTDTPRCQMYRDNLDAAVAFLGERDVADAHTWQQAFEIASWNCARDLGGRVDARGHASWTGGWDWTSWTCSGVPCRDAFASCVQAQMDHGPTPHEDVDLRFTVVGQVSESVDQPPSGGDGSESEGQG